MQLELVVPSNVTLSNSELGIVKSYMDSCKELRFLADSEENRVFLYDASSYAEDGQKIDPDDVEEVEEALPEVPAKDVEDAKKDPIAFMEKNKKDKK